MHRRRDRSASGDDVARRAREHRVRHADRGVTFVEILVSIVLLGSIVVASLAGLRAAIVGSEVDEDSARAHAWLQAAADEIHATPYLSCATTPAPAIESGYQTAADVATVPNEWTGATIVVASVQFLSGTGATEAWGTTCAAGNPLSPIYPQLVRLEVVDPDGRFAASLEVIKSV